MYTTQKNRDVFFFQNSCCKRCVVTTDNNHFHNAYVAFELNRLVNRFQFICMNVKCFASVEKSCHGFEAKLCKISLRRFGVSFRITEEQLNFSFLLVVAFYFRYQKSSLVVVSVNDLRPVEVKAIVCANNSVFPVPCIELHD